jgi:hypothetical protein
MLGHRHAVPSRRYLDRVRVEVTSSSFIPEKNVVLLKTKRKAVIRINAKAMRMDVAFPPGSRIESGFITRLLLLIVGGASYNAHPRIIVGSCANRR